MNCLIWLLSQPHELYPRERGGERRLGTQVIDIEIVYYHRFVLLVLSLANGCKHISLFDSAILKPVLLALRGGKSSTVVVCGGWLPASCPAAYAGRPSMVKHCRYLQWKTPPGQQNIYRV